MHKVLENIISPDELRFLKEIFATHPHVYSHGMDKVMLPLAEEPFKNFVTDLIERRLAISEPYVIVGDNFYKHGTSYFPHCDAIEDSAWLNIVLPIERYNVRGDQKFVVFDQTWSGKNITWLGEFKLDGDFYSNKKTNDRPCDGEFFQAGTDKELPEDIWQHLEQRFFKRDYFWGMSGVAYPWAPGNVLVFDSNHIHATGKMQSEQKLGVSIRIAHK